MKGLLLGPVREGRDLGRIRSPALCAHLEPDQDHPRLDPLALGEAPLHASVAPHAEEASKVLQVILEGHRAHVEVIHEDVQVPAGLESVVVEALANARSLLRAHGE
eukprot:13087289-Alexandrium_andersonii.AAC.1